VKRFAIVSKEDTLTQEVQMELLNKMHANNWELDQVNPELVISIGGDGTFLRAIHKYMDKLSSILFVGIHTGTLGFYTNYKRDEIDLFIHDLSSDNPTVHRIPLLGVEIAAHGTLDYVYAVNEIRVENIIRTQLMRIYIDEEYMETFRGTGVCISTQAGSTAYNRSAGGAILQEGLDFLQLTEITGIHHHAYRSLGSPFIIKKDSEIRLESDNFLEAILCYDHLVLPLLDDSVITVGYCTQTINLLVRPQFTYIQRLKSLF